MAAPKGEDRHKIMAVVLHTEFGYSQRAISELMKVSPSTISSWITLGKLIIANRNLEAEVGAMKEKLSKLGYNPIKSLEEGILAIDTIDV